MEQDTLTRSRHHVSVKYKGKERVASELGGSVVWWAVGGRCAKLESELKELSFPAIQSLRFDAAKKIGVATLYSTRTLLSIERHNY